MKHLIYLTPIILSISACGGGSVIDDCTEFIGPLQIDQELPEMYCPINLLEQHNEMTGKKGIIPVDCVATPSACT